MKYIEMRRVLKVLKNGNNKERKLAAAEILTRWKNVDDTLGKVHLNHIYVVSLFAEAPQQAEANRILCNNEWRLPQRIQSAKKSQSPKCG